MSRDDGTLTAPITYSTILAGTTLTTNVDGASFTIRSGPGATSFGWCSTR